MIAYKATLNGKCINIKYEVGKTYALNGDMKLCESGFHFCLDPDNIFLFYKDIKDIVLLEIEILGKIISEDGGSIYNEKNPCKCITNKFKVLRIIPKYEYNKIFKFHKFDNNYNLISEKDSWNNDWIYEYDSDNKITKILRKNYRCTYKTDITRFYNNKNKIEKEEILDTYQDDMSSTKKIITYQYDSNDNLISKREELFKNNSKEKNVLIYKTVSIYEYHDNKLIYFCENDKENRIEYDQKGNKIKEKYGNIEENCKYDDKNNLIYYTRKGIVSDIFRQYNYDYKNRLICEISNFEKRIYDYDENDNLIYFKKVNNEYPDKNIEYSISIE